MEKDACEAEAVEDAAFVAEGAALREDEAEAAADTLTPLVIVGADVREAVEVAALLGVPAAEAEVELVSLGVEVTVAVVQDEDDKEDVAEPEPEIEGELVSVALNFAVEDGVLEAAEERVALAQAVAFTVPVPRAVALVVGVSVAVPVTVPELELEGAEDPVRDVEAVPVGLPEAVKEAMVAVAEFVAEPQLEAEPVPKDDAEKEAEPELDSVRPADAVEQPVTLRDEEADTVFEDVEDPEAMADLEEEGQFDAVAVLHDVAVLQAVAVERTLVLDGEAEGQGVALI